MVKNILVLLFVSICLSTAAQTPKFKVLTTDFSKGNNPGKEYIELLVLGSKTCSEALGGDSIAHLGNYVIYDKNGDSVYYINTDTFPGITSGHYRFPNTPTWDSVPYGSLIIIYNNREKNNRMTLKDNLTGSNGTYVIPVDSLLRYNNDTLTTALPDSIIPTPQPPFFTLGEDSNAYIKNPVAVSPLPTQNSASNWGIEVSGNKSLNETPGFFTSDALNQWRNNTATPAVYPIKVGLKVAPPTFITFQGITDTIFYCSSTFKFVGSTSLPQNSANFAWLVNGVLDTTITTNNDTIPNNSDSLIKIIHQNNKVVFRVSTTLKCISGADTVYSAPYKAFNVYPDGDTLKVAIGVAINGDTTQKAKVDSFGTDALGKIDSTISYKYICKGSVATYYPLPNHSGTSDLYTWVKNGVIVAKDSLYTDSSIGSSGRSIDTVFCILNSSLNCVDKPSDTTMMIVHVLDSIPIPTITIKADTSVCSNATDSFFASFNYSSAKRDTTSRYNIVWMVNNVPQPADPTIYKDGDTIISFVGTNLSVGADSVQVYLFAKKTQSCLYDTTLSPATLALSDTSSYFHLNVIQAINPVVNAITPTQSGLCKAPFIDSIQFMTTSDTATTGTSPKYLWYLNGALQQSGVGTIYAGTDSARTGSDTIISGVDTSIYSNYGLLRYDIDTISVQVINTTAKCFINSDTSVLVILPLKTFDPYPPKPSSVLHKPSICGNNLPSNVVFFPDTTNDLGTRPTYQWYLNGQFVSDSSAYLYNHVVNQDTISLFVTSNVACATPRIDTNGVRINIPNPDTASIFFDTTFVNTTKHVCQNETLSLLPTLDSKSSNKNGNTFDVYVNNAITQNRIQSPINLSGLPVGLDSIFVVMHSSLNCLANPNDTSNTIYITVNPTPLPGSISMQDGSNAVCVGSYKSLTETVTGGYWSTNNAFVDTVDVAGNVHGVSVGSNLVYYTVVDLTSGCRDSANISINVNQSDVAQDSLLHSNICPGMTDTIYNINTQGNWISNNPAIATVIAGVDANNVPIGLVTANAAGLVIIKDSIVDPTCGTTTRYDTLLVGPPIVLPVIGKNTICTITDTIHLFDTTALATGWTTSWSSSNPSVASVDPVTGIVTAISGGSTTITYSVTNNCGTGSNFINISVGPPSTAGSINGTSILCVNSSTINNPFTNSSVPNGIWSSDNKSVATIDSLSGVATGHSVGADSIRYTVSNSCGSISTAVFLTTEKAFVLPPITSANSDSIVCNGTTLQMADAITGGTWSISNSFKASIDPNSGLVTAGNISQGLDTIKYSITNTCGTKDTTLSVIVGNPIEGNYSFKNPICVGDTIKLTNSVRGATGIVWGASQTTIAQVVDVQNGITAGVGGGTTGIYLLLSNKCTPKPIYIQDTSLTVNALPVVPSIVGKTTLCAKDTTTYTDASAIKGVWSSASPQQVNINPATGFITGVGAGNATIGYKVVDPTTGCINSTSQNITIDTLPKVLPITGNAAVCYGRIDTLKNATPTLGVTSSWISANSSVAIVTNTGLVLGTNPGSTNISYLVVDGNSCRDSATLPFTVNAIPTIQPIVGTGTICVGKTATLTDALAGGTWSTQIPGFATISNAGLITGVAVGTDTIAYKVVTNGCDTTVKAQLLVTTPSVAKIVLVNPLVDSVNIHKGLETHLEDPTPNGVWSSTSTSIASVNNGAVTGVYPGSVSIIYTITEGGCDASDSITITVLDPLNDIYAPNFLAPYSNVRNIDPTSPIVYPNRVFRIWGEDMASIDLKLFSPWGELMYQVNTTDNNYPGWDGTHGGQIQPSGVYVYVAKITLKNGKTLNKKGAVNLIR